MRLIPVLVAAVLFGTVAYFVDLRASLGLIARADAGWLALAAAGHLLTCMVKTWRWSCLLRALEVSIGWRALLPVYLMASYLGAALPAWTGDALRVVHVQRAGFGSREALAAYLADRLWDAAVLVSVAALALSRPTLALPRGPIVALLAVAAAAAALLLRRRLAELGALLRRSLARSAPAALPATALQSALYLATNYALLAALGLALDASGLLLCVATLMGVAAVPVSVSGIGTREASLLYVFSKLGLPGETAVAYSLLELLFIHVVEGGLALLAWLARRQTAATG